MTVTGIELQPVCNNSAITTAGAWSTLFLMTVSKNIFIHSFLLCLIRWKRGNSEFYYFVRLLITIWTYILITRTIGPFDYILNTNLMHWLLFIHKILFSSTCFEPQVLIFRRIQLYTCSIWYCHSVNRSVVKYY
jgi:hypothetical protein